MSDTNSPSPLPPSISPSLHPSPPSLPPSSNQDPALQGFVDWSLTNFTVNKLLEGAFPAFSAHELQVYDRAGEILQDDDSSLFSSNFAVFVPFVDFECLKMEAMMMGGNISGFIRPFNETDAVAGLGGVDAEDALPKYV